MIEGIDKVVAQALQVLRVMAVANKLLAARIQAIEPFGGSDPKRTRGILGDGGYDAIAEALGVGGVVRVAEEPPGDPIVPVQTLPGADPQRARPVLVEGRDGVPAQAEAVFRIVPVDLETVAIVPIQTVVGTHPDVPLGILEDARDNAVRETLLDGDALELGTCTGPQLALGLTGSRGGRPGPSPVRCVDQSRQGDLLYR